MAVTYEQLMSAQVRDVPFSYGERDVLLYAVSVGMGRTPLDRRELPFVYEGAGLRPVPSMACVLAPSGLLTRTGIDYGKVLHGAQSLVFHRPLPTAADLLVDARVEAVFDRGPAKGAIIHLRSDARTRADDRPLFSMTMTIMARGDGGCGGPARTPPAPHPLPERPPDAEIALDTRPEQALLYRLNGDRNPLHADPAVAKRAGFEVPILHGLCTYGIACRAVLHEACGDDPAALAELDARFSSPVFPGDRILTELWRDGPCVSFRCRVPERNVVVLDHGRAALHAPSRSACP